MKVFLRIILFFVFLTANQAVFSSVKEVNSIAELKQCGYGTVKYNIAQGTQVVALISDYSGDNLFLWDGEEGVRITGLQNGYLSQTLAGVKPGQSVSGFITGTYSATQGIMNNLSCTPGDYYPNDTLHLELGGEGMLTPKAVTVEELNKAQGSLDYVNSYVKVHGVPAYYNYANVFFDDSFTNSIALANDFSVIPYDSLNGYNNQKGYFTGIVNATQSHYSSTYGLDVVDSAWFESEGMADAKKVEWDALRTDSIVTAPLADVTIKNLNMEAGGFYPLCLPFNVGSELVKEVFGGDMKAYAMDVSNSSMEAGKATFAFKVYDVDSYGGFYAGSPVIVMPSKDVDEASFGGVSISSTSPGQSSYTDWTTYESMAFKGTFAPYALMPADLFVSTEGVLANPAQKGDSLRAFGAYFSVPVSVYGDQPSAQTVSLVIDGVALSIAHVATCRPVADGCAYTINGVRLDKNALKSGKGIYVVNGKKILVK